MNLYYENYSLEICIDSCQNIIQNYYKEIKHNNIQADYSIPKIMKMIQYV